MVDAMTTYKGSDHYMLMIRSWDAETDATYQCHESRHADDDLGMVKIEMTTRIWLEKLGNLKILTWIHKIVTSIPKIEQWSLPISICYLFLTKLSDSNILFQFLMPCKRLNCAQCLTLMVLKNQTRRVKRFLAQLEHSHPFDPCRCPLQLAGDSSDFTTPRGKTSLKLKNISSSIPTSRIFPSRNSHQHLWIQISNWSIKCAPSTP